MKPPIIRIFRSVAAGIVSASLMLTAQAGSEAPARLSPLTGRISISGQIGVDQLAALKAGGITTIIALRPDGEAPGQVSAAQMQEAARRHGIRFAYVPVAPGPIPEAAVTALDQALQGESGKVLMYCRSGSRAARTWSLVEAARHDGKDTDAILSAVRASGQSAEDLRAAIAARVAARPAP